MRNERRSHGPQRGRNFKKRYIETRGREARWYLEWRDLLALSKSRTEVSLRHRTCTITSIVRAGNMDQTDDATHHIMRGGGGAVERRGEPLAGVVWVGGARPGGEGRAGHQDDPVEEEPWAPGDRTQETQTP